MFNYRLSNKYVFESENEVTVDKLQKILIKNQKKYYKFLHPEWTHKLRDIEIELLAKPLNKNQKILEIGSGDGYIASVLKENMGLNVIASDLEPRYPQYTSVLKVDGKATEFKSKEYDAIISLHVLEHIEDIEVALEEFKRLLKDDGVMYHVVPSVATIFFTSLMQPISYIRLIWLYANGYFIQKFYPFKNRNILRFFHSGVRALNPLNFIWGTGHGVHNRYKCFKYWKIKNWIRLFENNGLSVRGVDGSEIAYSMHKIFPFKFKKIRKFLAKKMKLGSANLFIVEKERGKNVV